MINEKEFQAIKERYDAADAAREAVIKQSRDLLKLSKQAIYSLQRGEKDEAGKLLTSAAILKEQIEADAAESARTGMFSNALEEYAEAKALFIFVTESRIATLKELALPDDAYLGGLADLTGELGRMAVIAATKKELERVELIKEAMELLYGQFVQFDFRNGELRRKYDAIKYNLQKVENVLYDLKLGGRNA